MAKYGNVTAQIINITCPYCFSGIENDRGSTDISIGDDTQWDREAKVRFLICYCGKRVNIGSKATI